MTNLSLRVRPFVGCCQFVGTFGCRKWLITSHEFNAVLLTDAVRAPFSVEMQRCLMPAALL